MTRAFHADSYHFELTAPAGSYIFSHHLETLGGREPVFQRALTIGGKQQYVRLYHEEGRSLAHLYVRRLGPLPDFVADKAQELSRPDLKSIVRFREIPPGALGNAALLATITTIVIAFFGISRVGLDSPVGSSSLPALVLALPAFIASALGRSMDHEKIGRAPLTAYFGMYLVTGLSLASALLYILEASMSLERIQAAQLAGEKTVPGPNVYGELNLDLIGSTLVLHTDVYWLLIFVVSAISACYLLHQRRNTTKYYLEIAESRALGDSFAARRRIVRKNGFMGER